MLKYVSAVLIFSSFYLYILWIHLGETEWICPKLTLLPKVLKQASDLPRKSFRVSYLAKVQCYFRINNGLVKVCQELFNYWSKRSLHIIFPIISLVSKIVDINQLKYHIRLLIIAISWYSLPSYLLAFIDCLKTF